MDYYKDMKIENNVIHMAPLDYIPDPRGTGYVFHTHMKANQNKIAQIDGLSGEIDTYGSLLQRCIRTSLVMRSKNIKPNDIITLCTYNTLNSCVPYLATFFVGAVSSSLDPSMPLKDVAYLLNKVPPKMIFVTSEAVELIEKALERINLKIEIVVFEGSDKHTSFAEFLRPHPEEDHFHPYESKSLKDDVIIFFSSGTSGMPKGIRINHYTFLGQSKNTIYVGGYSDLVLAFASSYWITHSMFWGSALLNSSCRLIVPKFDLDTVWYTISTFKPTSIFMAPSQVVALYKQGRPKTLIENSVKDICIGGGSMSKDQILKMQSILPESLIYLAFGQTELAGCGLAFKPSESEDVEFIGNKPGSSGRPMWGFSYKVVDPDTEIVLGPYQHGELLIKSQYQLSGYYNQDSSEAWDSEGWLRTGDIVYYDDDLCFYVVDRRKEMLKFQSWHVPPVAIENVLLTHPDIEIAVVMGVPHEEDGEHPMAIVQLKDTAKTIYPEEIEKYVEERVDNKQRLRGGVRIVERIPVTPSGKVMRREIKQMTLGKIR